MRKRISAHRGYLITAAREVIVSAYGLNTKDKEVCRRQVKDLLDNDKFACKEIQEVWDNARIVIVVM
jgi:hypothetical protein